MLAPFSFFTSVEVAPSKHESRKLFHLFPLNMYAYTNLWHLLCFRIKVIRGVHDSLFSRLWFLECSQSALVRRPRSVGFYMWALGGKVFCFHVLREPLRNWWKKENGGNIFYWKLLFVYIFVNTWDREGHPTYMIRVSVPSFVIRLVKMRLYGLIKACACMCACAGVFSKFLLWRQIRNPSYYKEDYTYLNMFARVCARVLAFFPSFSYEGKFVIQAIIWKMAARTQHVFFAYTPTSRNSFR